MLYLHTKNRCRNNLQTEYDSDGLGNNSHDIALQPELLVPLTDHKTKLATTRTFSEI